MEEELSAAHLALHEKLRDDASAENRQLEYELGRQMVEGFAKIHASLAELITVRAAVDNLATRVDAGFAQLRGEMSELRGEMSELRGEMRGEMSELRGEIRGEMSELRGEIRGEIGQLRGELLSSRAELMLEMAKLRTDVIRPERPPTP